MGSNFAMSSACITCMQFTFWTTSLLFALQDFAEKESCKMSNELLPLTSLNR